MKRRSKYWRRLLKEINRQPSPPPGPEAPRPTGKMIVATGLLRPVPSPALGANYYSPERVRKRKNKTKRGGHPVDYDVAAILQTAKDCVRSAGVPDTHALFMEKVEDACAATKPRILVPKRTRLQELTREIYQRAKAANSSRKKALEPQGQPKKPLT